MRILLLIVAFFDLVFQIFFRKINVGLANRGVSFGFWQDMGNIISFIVFMIFIFWYLDNKIHKKKDPLYLFLLALGGCVNLISRLIWGNVWDYICLAFLPFCFNLSDLLISFGVVSYILSYSGNRNNLRG